MKKEKGMVVPDDRRYTSTHEWHKMEGELVVIGITDHAANELTDITFVQLPEVGRKVKAGEGIGELESVKATSEFYTGISGEVVQINQLVMDNPAIVNQDPYGKGWLVKIKPSNPSEYEKLLTAEEYKSTIGQS